MATQVASFHERRAQLAYPAFRAAGWPVGSGATESGHKPVMPARLKRAGMRWARPHVNPLLALRTLECNGRWPCEGPALLGEHRQRRTAQRRQRQHAHQLARHPVLPRPCRSAPPPPLPAVPAPASRSPHSTPPPARHP